MTTPFFTSAVAVVVPLDGGDESLRALGPATDLADRIGCRIIVVSAVEDPHLVSRRRDELLSMGPVAALGEEDVVHVAVDPFAVDTITAWPDTVVCMATSANPLHLESYLGSMAEKVVRVGGRPTVLVGPSCEGGSAFDVRRVLVPIDPARGPGGSITVAEDLAGLLGVDHEELTVGDGDDVADAITAHAARDAVVVMSTRARHGLARLLGGSTAAAVVRAAPRPVVVVATEDGSGA